MSDPWWTTPWLVTAGDRLEAVMEVVFAVTGIPVLAYFIAINLSYLALIVLASLEFARHFARVPFAGLDDVAESPLTLPVSVIVPGYNEEAGIVTAVTALLALHYPEHEVVVVDDGSKDGTFDALRATFDLVQVPRVVPDDIPVREHAQSIHVPRDGVTPLVVVRKLNSGRSDSVNLGINVARYPLVAMVDADSILDPRALLLVSKPFSDDPLAVVATGGAIRAVNGCKVVDGTVVEARMPTNFLARIQVMEYLRAFLLGRTAWSSLQSLVIISGAFGLFRRDIVVKVGGLDPGCIGEDFELVMRIHKHMRRQGKPYHVRFVAEPVSWTEVPSTRPVLASQRRRWHRGLWEVLWAYRGMLFNPRYGRLGFVVLPYYWVFELAAPILELAGLILVPLGLLTGVIGWEYTVAYVLAAYGFALLVSLSALLVEEFSFHRYGTWRDLWSAAGASVWENFGYRQMTAVWRMQGLWQGITKRKVVWGTMTRAGFGDTTPAPGVGSTELEVVAARALLVRPVTGDEVPSPLPAPVVERVATR